MNLFTAAEQTANYAEASVKKATMPLCKMILMAILAGMLIAFAGCVTNIACYALDNNSTVRTNSGLLFAFGLGMVILSGAELFTGNTLMTIGVLEKRITITP